MLKPTIQVSTSKIAWTGEYSGVTEYPDIDVKGEEWGGKIIVILLSSVANIVVQFFYINKEYILSSHSPTS